MAIKLTTAYVNYLHQVIDVLFDRADELDITWVDWAKKAGVSPTTVYRLGERETRLPQLRSIYLLASAIDCELPSVIRQVKGKPKRKRKKAA